MESIIMSVVFPDPISQNIYDNKKYFDANIRSLSQRQVRWMQEYLSSNRVEFTHAGSTNRHEEFIRQLAKRENFKELVSMSYKVMLYRLVPESNFGWLVNNLRCQIFIVNVLSLEYNYNFLENNSSKLMDEIYLFFDRKDFDESVGFKSSLINDIYQRWQAVYRKDNYSKWLKVDDGNQIEWSQDYLKRGSRAKLLFSDKESIEEMRIFVLASLDIIDYPVSNKESNIYNNHIPSARKEKLIEKMKRAWSQQKYRDTGKTKKPYHLPLTKKTKARLAKMSQVQGLSETAMLDILINRFYELDYVDINGKDLY